MSAHISKYDVVVLVKDNPDHIKGIYVQQLGIYRNWEVRKMKHIDARTPLQAENKASKFGKVLSVRKHDFSRSFEQIERIDFERTQPDKPDLTKIHNPYPNAIAMDEMIWKKNSKRGDRRNNLYKDKKNI